MTGHLFGDRYQVGDTLGFGGMSEVHRGRDLRLGRDVAIKVLRADLARDPSFQARFRREAQNAASLNHPAIVAVYDTGETQGESGPVPYIVMEYVDGETLRDLLRREGPLVPKRAMEIVADICAALDFSHRHGIVHRDIKPANVMLTRAGAVKVMDFGIARAIADGQATMTATAAVIGTAQYLSPEQARGEAVDARSDVYATGCVLYELLSGQPPFTGDSPVAVAYQHVREEPKPPSTVKPGLPHELDAIVLKALNKNPLNRYQTAAEMRADLVRALSGQIVQAPRVMTDAERTEIIGGAPSRVGPAVVPPPPPRLLAPPNRAMPQEDWEDDPETSRAKRIWGFVGIGVLCAALLAGAIWLTLKVTTAQPKPAQVSVPKITAMTVDQATETLRAAKLALGTQEPIESSDADKGKVIEQNPSEGTSVDQGRPVNIKVGQGVTAVQVPNLSGSTEPDAQVQLTKAGLKMKKVTATSEPAYLDRVTLQKPEAGTSVKPGSTVTITIGTGPEMVVIPDGLVGAPLADAEQTAKDAGLLTTDESTKSDKPKEEVLTVTRFDNGQPANPGDKVLKGFTIHLTWSDQSQFTMPNITQQKPGDAAKSLKQATWDGDLASLADGITEKETLDESQVGVIMGQNPAAGSVVDRTVKITTEVGKLKVITMPDLSGQTLDQAYGTLQALDWRGEIQTPNPPVTPAPKGKGNTILPSSQFANSQAPTAGSQLKITDPVAVNIYGAEPPPSSSSKAPTSPSATPGQTAGNTPPTRSRRRGGGGGGGGGG